jgi:hypothetical protein
MALGIWVSRNRHLDRCLTSGASAFVDADMKEASTTCLGISFVTY